MQTPVHPAIHRATPTKEALSITTVTTSNTRLHTTAISEVRCKSKGFLTIPIMFYLLLLISSFISFASCTYFEYDFDNSELFTLEHD
jgi:hypothetical protein